MKKKLVCTSLVLAESQNTTNDSQVFAICVLTETATDGKELSPFRKNAVIGGNKWNWLVDIGSYAGNTNEKKLEAAKSDFIDYEDTFNCIEVSVEELTDGEHKGFKVDGLDDAIYNRRLIGFDDDETLKSREKSRLTRQAAAGDLTWADE